MFGELMAIISAVSKPTQVFANLVHSSLDIPSEAAGKDLGFQVPPSPGDLQAMEQAACFEHMRSRWPVHGSAPGPYFGEQRHVEIPRAYMVSGR